LRHLRAVESLRIDAVPRDRHGGSRVATTQVEGASVLLDLIEVGSTLMMRAHATVLHPAHHRRSALRSSRTGKPLRRLPIAAPL
jgi:hypothetical protein